MHYYNRHLQISRILQKEIKNTIFRGLCEIFYICSCKNRAEQKIKKTIRKRQRRQNRPQSRKEYKATKEKMKKN